MKTKPIINHLYVEIPNFKNQTNPKGAYSYFLANVKKQLIFATNNYQLNLKTIYVANKNTTLLTIIFLEQLLLLLKPLTVTIKEYNFECTINNTNLITLQLFAKFKVNRLIWKIVTFQPRLTNKDNYQQSITIINDAINLHFTNFSIDLKYNLPEQTLIDINNDLTICMQLKTPHISYDSYNQKTNLNFRKNISIFLKKYNYHHYEYYSYSNNEQHYSKYIIAYCLLENYYGIGPHAVSYIKTQKQIIMITNNQQYQQKMIILSKNEIIMQKLIQGLLLRKGIIINKHDEILKQQLGAKLIKNGQLKIKNKRLSCTNSAWILLNQLIIDIITNTTI